MLFIRGFPLEHPIICVLEGVQGAGTAPASRPLKKRPPHHKQGTTSGRFLSAGKKGLPFEACFIVRLAVCVNSASAFSRPHHSSFSFFQRVVRPGRPGTRLQHGQRLSASRLGPTRGAFDQSIGTRSRPLPAIGKPLLAAPATHEFRVLALLYLLRNLDHLAPSLHFLSASRCW